MGDEAKAAIEHGTKDPPQSPVVYAFVARMAVEDHPALPVEAAIDICDDVIYGRMPGAVPFEQRYRPRSAQRHRNAPVLERRAGMSGMVRLAADRVAVVAISQLFDDTCNTFVGLEARRRESHRAAEQPSHFGVRIGYVLRDHALRQFKETTAPYHMVGAAVLAEFVACCRQFLQPINER